jgi:hypothetical protein
MNSVFLIRSVSDTIFAMLFLPKLPADHRWSADHILRNTGVQFVSLFFKNLPGVYKLIYIKGYN